MKLEVIAKNLRDIIKINKTNADQIEFCRNLAVGGLTPNKLIIVLATKISRIPINVMLRPSSESFNYSKKDFNKMLKDAAFLEKTKVNGVVFGILNDDRQIDITRMQQIIAKIPSKQKVFHKAFDQVGDFNQALDALAQLKIDTVLTAGGQDINQNLSLLASLKARNKVTVMAGGGVNFDNIKNIIPVVDSVHVGTTIRKDSSWNSKIDRLKINQIKQIIKMINKY